MRRPERRATHLGSGALGVRSNALVTFRALAGMGTTKCAAPGMMTSVNLVKRVRGRLPRAAAACGARRARLRFWRSAFSEPVAPALPGRRGSLHVSRPARYANLRSVRRASADEQLPADRPRQPALRLLRRGSAANARSGSGRSSGAGATRPGRRPRTTTCSWGCCRTPARRTSTRPSTTSSDFRATTSGSAPRAWSSSGSCRRSSCRRSCAHARLPHPRAGVDAGAQPGDGAQPRLRRLRADADPQRHGRDARRGCASIADRPTLLPAERRRDPLPVRAAGRGSQRTGRASPACTASSSISTRDGGGELRRGAEPLRVRPDAARPSSATARSRPSATSTASSRGSSTSCRRDT